MELRQITREILRQVEEVSSLPVHVVEGPKLATLTSVLMVRETMSARA